MENTTDKDKNTISQPYNEDQTAAGDTPMSDSEVLAFCVNEVARGIGGNAYGDEEEDVSLAFDYFYGRKPGISKAQKRDPQSSRFVSLDVMDAVEATVAEIAPTFMTDEVAFYNAENERDETQARTESDLVNYILFDECDGYSVLQAALRDTLLHRNCTAKVFWDERTRVEYEDYEGVNNLALLQILQPTAPNQEVEVVHQCECEMNEYGEFEEMPDDMEDMMEGMKEGGKMKDMMKDGMMEMSGFEMPDESSGFDNMGRTEDDDYNDDYSNSSDDANADMVKNVDDILSGRDADKTFNIRIKRKTALGKPIIEPVQPEQVIVSGDHNKPSLYSVRFVAHEKIETQSSLIEQGFCPKIVDQLEDYNTNVESISRSRTAAEYDYFASDRSVRHIRVFECYALLDVDGDGIAERRKIVYAGGQLLSNDPWTSVPMVGGVTTAIPHKYKGLSLFDRLKDIQDAKTPVIRSVIDGTRLSSNPRIGVVTGEVNIDDLLTSRVGGVVRAESANSVFEVPRAEVPASAYQMLGLMDNLRRERGGSAVGSATEAQKISNDSAHAFERTISAMELSNALLARTFGETLIKGIFVQMHKIIRENYQGEMTAKIGGKWITSVPSEWKDRTSVTVSIGASNAERQRQSMALSQVIGFQKELLQQGSTLTNDERAYKALTQAISLSGVKNPESFFIDPASEEGQQASQAKAQQAQEQQQIEIQMQVAMAESQQKLSEAEQMKGQAALQSQQVKFENDQLKAQIDQLKIQLDAKAKDDEVAFKYAKLSVEEALKLTELEVAAQKDLTQQLKENKTDE